MNSNEEIYGSLLFFRKDGQPSTTYPLINGKTTIGSSIDADIRFKMNNERLEDIHCIIEVNDVGIATLFNKSTFEPVKINSVSIRKNRILKVDDEIELVGKKFVYLNGSSSKKDSSLQKNVKKIRSIPSKERHSINPTDLKSGKKSSNFATKLPIQIRPSTRRYSSTSSDFTVSYEKEPDRGNILGARSKTTSKVIVSKAVGSPSLKRRRLSFGDKPKIINRNMNVSTRNILLNKSIISTITEEEKSTSPKLSISLAKLEKSGKQNDERNQRLDSNNSSSDDLIELNLSSNSPSSPIMSSPGNTALSSKKSTPRKSLAKKRLSELSVSKSPRNSLLRHCLQKNQDKSLTKSRESLRKGKTGEFNKQYSSEEFMPDSHTPNKYLTKFKQLSNKSKSKTVESSNLRKSLRKSKTGEFNEQLSMEESPASTSIETLFYRPKFSKHSSRKSEALEIRDEEQPEELLSEESESEIDRNIDEEYETQSSEEEPLIPPETRTPNEYLRKSRQSLNMSKTGEVNEQFTNEESPASNKSVRHSLRRSKIIIEKNEEAQLEGQFLSDESEVESGKLHISRNSVTSRKISELNETQSSNDESFLSESHTPNKYSRKSRRSLNKSEIVKSPNESLNNSVTRKSRNIGNREEQQNEELLDTFGTKSRHSLRKSGIIEESERMQNEQNKESTIVDTFESPLPNTSVKARESLMRHSIGKRMKHNEERSLSESESISTLKQRTSSKSNSVMDKDEHQQNPLRRLSINVAKLKTPNSETPKERCFSVRKSFRAGGDQTGESLLNIPTGTQEATTPKERRSSVRKSSKPNRNEETLESQSNVESLVVNVSTMSTLKETPTQRQSTASKKITPARKSNGLNEDEDIEELSSSTESLFPNVSPSTKEIFTQKPIISKEMRESLVRKSNRFNKDKEIEELSSSEESIALNISPTNSTKGTPMQRRLTATPKDTVASVRTPMRKSNKSNKNEQVGEQCLTEESLNINISTLKSPKEISQQRPSSTPKGIGTPLRKSRSANRNSIRLNRHEEIGELFSSEESFGPDDAVNSTPSEKSVQRRSTATPKEMKENRSSRKSNRLDQDEEINEQSSSEESFVLNISPLNSPEETPIQELSTTPKETVISVEPLNERSFSVRKSNRLNTNEENCEISPLVPNRRSTERKSSVRKSNKLNREVDIGELTSSEIFLGPDISEMNTSKSSTMTPKQMLSSVRTPKERGSSVRKSRKLNESMESLKWCSSEESLALNNSAMDRRSSVRKSKSISGKEIDGVELSVPNISTMNTPQETNVQRRLTTTLKELATSVGTPNESRTSARKSNRLNRKKIDNLSSDEESLDLGISTASSPKEKSVRRLATTPKEERGSSVRKKRKLDEDEESAKLSSTDEPLILNVPAMNRRSSVRKNNKSIRDEEIGGDLLISNLSVMKTPKETSAQRRLTTTPKELVTSVGTPYQSRISVRRSHGLNQKEEIDLSSSEESLNLNVSTISNPKEKSRQLSTTSKEERRSSVKKTTLIAEKFDDLPSSEDSLVSSMIASIEDSVEKQSSTTKKSIRMNRNRSSNQDSLIFCMSDSKISTPIPASHRNNITIERFRRSNYSSQSDSELSVESPQNRFTPKLRHSSVRKSQLKPEEEASETETSVNKSSSSRISLSRRSNKNISTNKLDKSPLTRSKQNISVITLNDSVELTPENNTSVVIINSSLEQTQKSTRKRLSKTHNSTLQDDVDLTTPKSAIKSRRPKSLPYNPIVEEISPASPLSKGKTDSGFKTPLNTPGLFEDIKKSVLRSRSQMQKSSINLMEELNKSEPKRGIKRPLDGSYVEATKKRKIAEARTSDTFDTEAGSRSFDSFSTEDILTDISEQNITQNTPKHFSDLTDKPVITHPQIRSSTEPKGRKSKPPRLSSHAPRLSSQGTADSSAMDDVFIFQVSSSEQDDSMFEATTSDLISRRSSRRSSLRSQIIPENDSPVKVQKSPKNDLSDVAGLKKLLKTPREIKSPKNDLTNVPNLRRLMSPKTNNSPRNDLTNIIGVKKLLATPKQMKSPRNDLRQIPNLRKLISPKQQNSPKNDLSDVAGVKKLLGTPKEIKSPKNDLRNVPNLRRLMSPSIQNSPENDLTDVRGVKKLFSTPKSQKSPKNDLTNVPNLRRIMSPKQQNTPKNDLTDVYGVKKMMATPRENRELQNDSREVALGDNIFNVSGVQRLSIESDIENNEDLFDKLFAKKPLRTYRGKSLSPASRKSAMFDDKRKTLGDMPYTSPRVEKWIEEQAVIKLNRIEDAHDNVFLEENKETPTKDIISEAQQESQKKRGRGRRVGKKASTSEELTVVKESKEESLKKVVQSRNISPINEGNQVGKKRKLQALEDEPDLKSLKKTTRSRRKIDEDVQTEQTQEYLEKKPKVRQDATVVDGEQSNNVSNTNETATDEVNSTNELEFKLPQVTRGRAKKLPQKDEIDQIPEVHSTTDDISSPTPKRGKGRRAKVIDQDENLEVLAPSPRRGGRTRNTAQAEIKVELKDEELPPPKGLRGKRKSPVKKDEEIGTGSDSKSIEKEEARSKRGRGRNVKVENEEQTTDNRDNIPVVTKRTRGRKPNLVVASESNSNITSTEPVQIVHQSETEIEIPKVSKSNTGKRRIGRNKKNAAEEETKSEDQKETEPVISTRAGKQPMTIKHGAIERGDGQISEPIKGTKKKAETNHVQDDIEIASAKPTRDRKRVGKTAKKLEEIEPTEVEDTEMASAKLTRGRKRVEKTTSKLEGGEEGDNESSEVEGMEMVFAKPTRGRKRVVKTVKKLEENEEGESVPTEVEVTEMASAKPTRGRKRVVKTVKKLKDSEEGESEPTEVEDMEMASAKPTRGRKRLVKTTKKLEESKNEPTEVHDVKTMSAKPTRGRKQLKKGNDKLEREEGESGPAEVDDTERASAKSTRGRKQPEKRVTSEESEETEIVHTDVKRVDRSKKPVEEMRDVEDDKTLVKPTRGRKPKAVDKAILEEASTPVDSPRTARAKRGNFNKYGSDFLTVQGKKEENKEKKHVRFEEEDSTNGKRKVMNVAKSEEVEETTRKSKRARK